MCTIVLHPVTHFSFLFLVAVVVVIRYLAERTSRVDWDGIRYTLFGQPVYQHSIYDGLRHRPDKLGLKKPLIWCMSFILVLTGPFMIYVYEPLLQSNFSVGLILGALFFGLGYLAGCGLLDSFTENGTKFSFRIWNSARTGIFWLCDWRVLCWHIFQYQSPYQLLVGFAIWRCIYDDQHAF